MTTIDQTRPSALATPGAWRVDPDHSTVAFEVRDMANLFATIRGRFTDFDGTIDVSADGARAEGSVRVASLTTLHAERDDNLRSAAFLDAAGAPEIRFDSDAFELRPDGSLRIAGRLELKGTRSEIELRGAVLGSGTDHRGTERLAIAAEGALPFGPMNVKLVVEVSAVRAG